MGTTDARRVSRTPTMPDYGSSHAAGGRQRSSSTPCELFWSLKASRRLVFTLWHKRAARTVMPCSSRRAQVDVYSQPKEHSDFGPWPTRDFFRMFSFRVNAREVRGSHHVHVVH